MKPFFVYSGTFDPPTYGHLALLTEAAKIFPHIIVVCSDHSRKKSKLSQAARVKLWQSYTLPAGTEVETFNQFMKRAVPPEKIILIRGIRGASDSKHETEVFLESAADHGITKAFYILCSQDHCQTSSSKVWSLAKDNNIPSLQKLVSLPVQKKVLAYCKKN